ncbi:MAG: phosphatidylglycerophosphatase A [Deltaproteobacteria bacterium CG_4_10_14_0_2_um_filter_43_8]|nr:MAG: phosphatidylglycerophosphatase A [Deltaproteobacteria bacterium CG11_big_fil_rev_8_21_14_0_20_42_23]PJA21548.1 MAG: phosphatidylglycerophosphatase A [Deltaproteobacteria bacterium CG_4_10_14_0_2_um_filter_43_8]PJC63474.1 MAG: phosphatidylglycerophosphatase A [Deltaproteobacteria bacterium CG_4_9_14_0_2_um_filter_42_21]
MLQFFKLFATGFGVGFLPKAPGTFGTLLAIPCYILLSALPVPQYLTFLIGFIFFSIWVSGNAIKIFDKKDPSEVVIDEVVGYFVTMSFVPFSWMAVALGFVFFRLFDIVKVWPANWVDRRVGGGIGIVMDDVVAAIYANLLLRIVIYFL